MNDDDNFNFTLTEPAVLKVKALISEEDNPALMLRVFWAPDGNWGFQFEATSNEDGKLLEFDGVKVLLAPSDIDSLRDATIDYNEVDSFVINNASIPEHADVCQTMSEGVCQHLADLPAMPSQAALTVMRKGLRKQKVPDLSIMTEGKHPKIGRFAFEQNGNPPRYPFHLDEIIVRWNLVDGPDKRATFADLCFAAERELDRLELGWMIANMAQLDMEHHLERARDIPNPHYCMREMSRITGHYEKIDKRWRHWAIVLAGHMLD